MNQVNERLRIIRTQKAEMTKRFEEAMEILTNEEEELLKQLKGEV